MGTAEYGRGRLGFRPRASNGTAEGRHEPLGVGSARDGVLYVPDTAEASAPIMVFLHGASGSGSAHLRPVLGAADRYGVIVVAPDSRSASSWDLIAEQRFGPDVAFLDEVLDSVADRVDADMERLALGGVSDGASYALSVGLSNGDVFAAVMAFSPGFLAVPRSVGRPKVFVSHGTADPILPIDLCSRDFVPALREAGYEVTFREFDGGHGLPPPVADEAMRWWLGPA
ncbi:MAG TPA: PHB depolymerase family esterase [Acidimicrobiales bacterium]|nr:PHB depolymerase family esterase [Acidimicrobiales bacterium]